MIKALMDDLSIVSSEAVLKIGDTEVDVEEGRNAACGIVVSVTTGAYTRDQLASYGPDFIIDDLRNSCPSSNKRNYFICLLPPHRHLLLHQPTFRLPGDCEVGCNVHPAWAFILYVSLTSFVVYACMYGFRKPFTAASYDGIRFFGISYKVVLVIAQVLGYMLSKFYGIRFIAGMDPAKRAGFIIRLILDILDIPAAVRPGTGSL
jgi:hypothetical protein